MNADPIRELVQHMEWRADGEILTRERFLAWASQHEHGLTAHDVDLAWNWFSLGQVRPS